MLAFKRIGFISFLLLSACAPKPPVTEVPQNIEPSITQPSVSESEKTTKNELLPSTTNNKRAKSDSLEQATVSAKEPSADNKKAAALDKNSTNSRISSWAISGAMAARSKGKGWSASVSWQQQGQGSYQIRLSGPLGSGTVLISRGGGVVTLRDGPKTVTSSNAESLLKQQTGVSLPVSKLFYWVRGIPAPGSIQGKSYDQSGHLLVLKQGGYLIQYQQYTSVGKSILPSNIKLQGNGVFIKLIIKSWRV